MDKKLARDLSGEVFGATGLAMVSAASPEFAVLCTFLFGVVKVISEWKLRRLKEIDEHVGHDRIVEIINSGDSQRDALHKILNTVMDESSKRKRELFYNYINSFSSLAPDDFDFSTKIITVLNLITLDEVAVLFALKDKYSAVLQKVVEAGATATGIEDVQRRGLNLTEIEEHHIYDDLTGFDLEDSFVNLGNYGLIYVKTGRWDGTMFGPLTRFGEIFVRLIETKK